MNNLNNSRKPDYDLNESLINEQINLYGLPVKILESERIAEDFIFRDFAGFKVDTSFGHFKDIVIQPEIVEDFDGDQSFGQFGFYNNQSAAFFISKKTILDAYGLTEEEFKKSTTRSKIINSLIITPGEVILEITDFTSSTPGVNRLFGFVDSPSVYKITTQVYKNNIADEGVNDIVDTFKLSEGDIDGSGDIFNAEDNINTDNMDDFFDSLEEFKDDIKRKPTPPDGDDPFQPDTMVKSGGVFGNLE